MTQELFRDEPYRAEAEASVASCDARGIVLDRTVFYPRGGGQAGDAGSIVRGDGSVIPIADTVKGEAPGEILHVPVAGNEPALSPGEKVTRRLDWDRHHRHMRFHTATHLLCAIVPHQTNGCSITSGYARLDCDMVGPLLREHPDSELARRVAAARARRRIFGDRYCKAGVQSLLGLRFLPAAAGAGFVAVTLAAYHRLTGEEHVANVNFVRKGDGEYTAMFTYPGADLQVFDLRGDDWQLDARVLKWSGPANLLGFNTLHS